MVWVLWFAASAAWSGPRPMDPSLSLVAPSLWRDSSATSMESVQAVLELHQGTHPRAVAAAVAGLGIGVEAVGGPLVQVSAPVAMLPQLAALPGVRRVRPPHRVSAAEVSEGYDVVLPVEVPRHGLSGEGVHVAVIDTGFAGYDGLLGDELPDTVGTWFVGGWDDSDHGTAVAEIVHDVAPDAQLTLLSFGTDVEFLAAVEQAVGAGAHVINASVGFDNVWHPDGEHPLAEAVDAATEQGVLWVNAVGNEADNYGSGALSDADGDGLLELDGYEDFPVLTQDGVVEVSLRWDEPFGAAEVDLDLVVLDPKGRPCGSSTDWQDGGGDPYEWVACDAGADWARVQVRGGGGDPVGRRAWLYSKHGLPAEAQSADGSLTLPADAVGALSVGAVSWWQAVPRLLVYSSRGPTLDGRTKPDLVAPTNVSTASRRVFAGTSAAAPHVSGVAALVLEGTEGPVSPAQLRAWLLDRTYDLGPRGSDDRFGAGLLRVRELPHHDPPVDTAAEDTGSQGASCSSVPGPFALGGLAALLVFARRRRGAVLFALAAPWSAAAHLPHDEIQAVAMPLALDDSSPWLAYAFDGVAVSQDGGVSWAPTGSLVSATASHEGGVTASGAMVFCDEDQVVYSLDDGATYGVVPTDGPVLACTFVGDDLVLSTRAGLYRGQPHEALTRLDPVAPSFLKATERWVAGIDEDGGRLVALAEDSALYFVALPDLPALPTSAVVVDASTSKDLVAYVGYDDGRVWRYRSGSWRACGDLPAASHPGVYQMAATGSTVLVAPASLGPYTSEDDCVSWNDRTIDEPTEFVPTTGGAYADHAAYTSLHAVGDTVVLAGWAGLYVSWNGGVDWSQAPTVGPDRTEGVMFGEGFPTNPTVYLATFAAGPGFSVDLGVSFRAPAYNVTTGNATKFASVPGDPDHVFGLVNHEMWESYDGGWSWESSVYPFFNVLQMGLFATDDYWLVSRMFEGEYVSKAAHSVDLGQTWTPLIELDEALGSPSQIVRIDLDDGVAYCAATSVALACAPDRKGPWTTRMEYDYQRIGVFAIWPEEGVQQRAALATDAGIHLTVDGGETWSQVYTSTPDGVSSLGFAPDGTGLGVTAGGRVLVSEDGSSWADAGVQLPGQPYTLSIRPDWDDYSQALVGTSAGAFVLDVDALAVAAAPWGSWQRVDNASSYLVCTGSCVGEANEAASMSSVTRVEEGVSLQTWIRGHTVRVLGLVESEGSEASVRVDGEPVGTLAYGGATELGLLFEVTGLEDVAHSVEIDHQAGSGVLVDAVEAYGDGVPLAGVVEPVDDTGLDTDDTSDTAGTSDTDDTGAAPPPGDDTGSTKKGCGCVSGGAAGGWLALGAVVLVWRRRPARRLNPSPRGSTQPERGVG